jgi:predicted DNA-binding transcriptional regulator YafY
MPGVADRVERLTELVMILLDAPSPRSFEDLAAAGFYDGTGESARRAFERDKASLKAIGAPLLTTWEGGAHGTARYAIRPQDWFLDLDLTEAELIALHLAAGAVRLDADWDERALLHLGGDMGRPVPVIADLPTLDALPVLYEATQRRAEALFSYRGRARTVHPHGVFYRDGNWYLTADDDGVRKVFRVDRIEGDVELGREGAYRLVPGEDPARAMAADPLLIGEGDETTGTVALDRTAAARVTRMAGARVVATGDDGSATVEVTVRNRPAFRSWVLGLGDHAVVVGPADLRHEVVTWLRAVAATEAA